MTRTLVVILIGSKADLDFAKKISNFTRMFGIEVVIRIGSAHKTSEHVLSLLQLYEQDPRPKVYITVAGRSNALSGFIDGLVSAPVIACPPGSEVFGGADIYSSLRMPSGIAPAVILEPQNAALFAAKILSYSDPGVMQALLDFKAQQKARVIKDDEDISQ